MARVAPIDKSSTILTMLLAIPILGEIPTPLGVLCMVVMGAGTLLMVGNRRPAAGEKPSGSGWLAAAWASAVFAALTSILTKLGVTGIDSTLGTAVRTTVVLVMAWVMVLFKTGLPGGKNRQLRVLYRWYTSKGTFPPREKVYRLCCFPAAHPPILRSIWVRILARL